MIEEALGEPLEKLFISFGPPVAAASIAQVHHAEVVSPKDRKPVAVKVLRPGIERRFASISMPSCSRPQRGAHLA